MKRRKTPSLFGYEGDDRGEGDLPGVAAGRLQLRVSREMPLPQLPTSLTDETMGVDQHHALFGGELVLGRAEEEPHVVAQLMHFAPKSSAQPCRVLVVVKGFHVSAGARFTYTLSLIHI